MLININNAGGHQRKLPPDSVVYAMRELSNVFVSLIITWYNAIF